VGKARRVIILVGAWIVGEDIGIKLAPCNFGDKCINIYKDGKLYENYDSKVCQFLHMDESLDNFYERVLKDNIKKAKEMRKKVEKKTESLDLEKGEENKSNCNNAFQKNKPIIVSFP
jgi:hypothetical protein